MDPEDRSLFGVETSLSPFYIPRFLPRSFYKASCNPLVTMMTPPPCRLLLNHPSLLRTSNNKKMPVESLAILSSRLNTFGVSPSATTVLIAPPAILSPHASRHQLSSVYFGWQSCPRLLSSVYFNCRSCQSEPPGLGSRLSRPADTIVSIALDNLISSEPLGRLSRLLTSFDDGVAIKDDEGINLIPSESLLLLDSALVYRLPVPIVSSTTIKESI